MSFNVKRQGASIAVLALIIVIGFFSGFFATHLIMGVAEVDTRSGDSSPDVTDPDVIAAVFTPLPTFHPASQLSPTEAITPPPTLQIVPDTYNMDTLASLIYGEIGEYVSNWQVVIAPLDNRYKSISCCQGVDASDKMISASLIKLFVMAAVYDEIYNSYDTAEAMEDDVSESLYLMIANSDNKATNRLLEWLGEGSLSKGLESVNRYCENNGFYSTEITRQMVISSSQKITSQNYTSAQDCADLLYMIYNGNCVNEDYSAKMLEMLKAQTRLDKIPQGILNAGGFKDGEWVANKTGELAIDSVVHNDGAIVSSQNIDYIICVLGQDILSDSQGISAVQNISTITYEFFNPRWEEE